MQSNVSFCVALFAEISARGASGANVNLLRFINLYPIGRNSLPITQIRFLFASAALTEAWRAHIAEGYVNSFLPNNTLLA